MEYYGDKISENMKVTPEGFLICENVPIGRIGEMDYLGQEIPAAFGELTGSVVKVYRSPEELFSPTTIASFEGKSATNTHPTSLLDVNTALRVECGHAQNIRRDGDFLVADLLIKEAGLISEIQNGLKREVSSGYNCSWHKIGEGKYEQREITGNHVAVVQSGRAGPKVAIMDSALKSKETGGRKKMGKITKNFLTALGFKAFAADAEPEDIAKAMDAMNEEDPEGKKPAKDADPEPEDKKEDKKEPAQDAMPAWAQTLVTEVQALRAEVKDSKPDDKETAESVMDAVEEELKEPAKDADPEPEKEPAKDTDPSITPPVSSGGNATRAVADASSGVADAAIRKIVMDMKPIIMAIPDQKARLEAAKAFKASVQDARSYGGKNEYSAILSGVAANKMVAMDAHAAQQQTVSQRSETACKNWSEQGEKMKGGK